jgi:hypothetical protein
MKTKEQLQTAVDELREVCRKHDIALVGTFTDGSVYGEITIGEATQAALGWIDVAAVVDNTVKEGYQGSFNLGGIGDVRAV